MALSEKINAFLTGTLRNMIILDIESETLRFERQIIEMRQMGMSQRQIVDAVYQDFLSDRTMFGSFQNAMADRLSNAVGQLEEIAAEDVYAGVAGEILYKWITVGDDVVCTDCEEREGEVRSLGEWQDVGIPASGFSVCGARCRCKIVPEGIDVPTRISLNA